MKSPDEALCAGVEAISSAVERGQFHLAAGASGNLTRLAHSLESAKDAFVGDVVGAACGDVDYVLRSYIVGGKDAEAIRVALAARMADLADARKERQDVCRILQQVGYAAASFVLAAEQRYPPRPSTAERGGRSQALSLPSASFEASRGLGRRSTKPYEFQEKGWLAMPGMGPARLFNEPTQPTHCRAETRKLRYNVAGLRERVDWLVAAVRDIKWSLEARSLDECGPDNYDMDAEQVRRLILENYELGECFYPSDIADKYGLNYGAVLEAIDMLRKERRIKDEA